MKRTTTAASTKGKKKRRHEESAAVAVDENDPPTNRVHTLEETTDIDSTLIATVASTSKNAPGDPASCDRNETTAETKYGEFYKRSENGGNKYGECLLCSEKGATTIIKTKDSNTTGLRRHLLAFHKDNPAIQKMVGIGSDKRSPAIQKSFDQRIVEWLAIKCLPFSFFDDDATQEFFLSLNNNETYPKRTSTRDKVIKHYSAMKAAVFKTLQEIPSKFSLTVDGWTSIANQSYYGVTIHFVDDQWVLQSLPLDFIPCHGRHTGQQIANLIRDVLDEFDVKSRLQGITLDNAAANTTFVAELSELLSEERIQFDAVNGHFRCFAHILNLGVQDTLRTLNSSPIEDESAEIESDPDDEERFREVEESDKGNVVNKVRRLFLKIKRSEQWTTKLANCCDAVNAKNLSPTIDVPTRWNSTYKMLRTAITMKLALEALIHLNKELQEMTISSEDWAVLEIICSYMKPFDNLSTILGGEKYVTLPLVIVGFNMLLDRIEAVVNELDSKLTRSPMDVRLLLAFQAGRDKMLKHYRKTNWIYGVVLILDPRHKVETFSLTPWGLDLKEGSVEKFEEIFKEYYCPTCTSDASSSAPISSQENDSFDLYALYESSSQIWHKSNCSEWRTEFERYCKARRASQGVNILEWWSEHTTEYPNMAKMARDFLSISATSVPAERLFSKAGLILRKHRSRLSRESARSLLCLNGWLTCSIVSRIQGHMNLSG